MLIRPEKKLPTVSLPDKPRVYLIDRPGSEQSMIIAGELIPAKNQKDEIAVGAMDDILGGAFTSRMEAKDGSAGFDFAGVYTADAGEIRLEGRSIAPADPLAARHLGIAMVRGPG